MEQTANKTKEIDLRKILHLVLQKWYWFLIGLVAFVLLGVWYLVQPLRSLPRHPSCCVSVTRDLVPEHSTR